jgi:hypothetical protein
VISVADLGSVYQRLRAATFTTSVLLPSSNRTRAPTFWPAPLRALIISLLEEPMLGIATKNAGFVVQVITLGQWAAMVGMPPSMM